MGSHSEAAAVAAGIHAIVFDDGKEVTYQATSDDTAESITCIVHAERIEQRQTTAGIMDVEVRMVAVEFTELDSPVLHGIVTIDDVPWSIDSIGTDSSRWLLNLTKLHFVERSRNNYRGAR